MKLFLVLLCIGLSSAAPAAEGDAKSDATAEPWLGYGYPAWGWGGWGGYGYGGWGGYYGHYLGKRSADSEAAPVAEAKADADADPWLLYANNWNNWYNRGAWGNWGNWGWGYPAYSAYYPYAYGNHWIGKRSAEAEAAPTAEPNPQYWGWNNWAWGYPTYSWSYRYPYYARWW